MLKGWETDLLRELKAAVDILKLQMVRVKTEGVKDNVDKFAQLFSTFTKVRDELGIEWQVRIGCVDRKSAEADRITDQLEATEKKTIAVLGIVFRKLAEHDKWTSC